MELHARLLEVVYSYKYTIGFALGLRLEFLLDPRQLLRHPNYQAALGQELPTYQKGPQRQELPTYEEGRCQEFPTHAKGPQRQDLQQHPEDHCSRQYTESSQWACQCNSQFLLQSTNFLLSISADPARIASNSHYAVQVSTTATN